ncbi:MAG: dimethylarginine dimethylaminohydrolase family protein [Novosphingobium sp.]
MTTVFNFTHAILRRPGASVVKGLRAGGGPDPDLSDVLAEHAAYAAALRDAGLELTVLDPLDAFPDAIFVEDPALVFPDAAIVLKPGAPSREAEGEYLRPALAEHFDRVIDPPGGHADGGDVLVLPDRVLVGLSARTDRAGAAALCEVLGSLGYRAEVAETPDSVLHLKTASSLLDEETVLSTRELAATGIFADYRVITVPEGEEGGANVLRVNDRVLAGAGHARVLDLLDRHGLNVVPLANSAIAAIDAGFTCMSLRWASKR